MTLTINFTDQTKCLAFCNINIDTDEPDAILTAYQETIPKVHTPGYSGTAAHLLQEVTGIVMQEHPGMVVVSVTMTETFSAAKVHLKCRTGRALYKLIKIIQTN